MNGTADPSAHNAQGLLLSNSSSCTDSLEAVLLPPCGGVARHWLPLVAAMVAAGALAAGIAVIGWRRLSSRRSKGHRYLPAGTADARIACVGELEAGPAGEGAGPGAGAGAGEVELGSWHLQSTTLRLRRQEFEFLRGNDGQPVMLGRGGTAKASKGCCGRC